MAVQTASTRVADRKRTGTPHLIAAMGMALALTVAAGLGIRQVADSGSTTSAPAVTPQQRLAVQADEQFGATFAPWQEPEELYRVTPVAPASQDLEATFAPWGEPEELYRVMPSAN